MAREPVYSFGDYELDPVRFELRHRGRRVELHAKPLRLLLYLVQQRDRAVPKTELLARVWPDVVVSETALSSALKEVRRAVGDDGAAQRVVQTLRGVGYRFVPRVVEADGAPAPQSEGGAAAPVDERPGAPPLHYLAVLPLRSLSPDRGDEYFADGVTEDIVTQVSKLRDLRVVSATSSRRYKGSEKGLREIAEELGVGSVVEGSVRRDGDRVRIAVQLIDASSDTHLWAETYDRTVDDIFQIQQDLSERVAATLRSELSQAERRLLAKRPTRATSAYDVYMKGRELYRRWTRQDNEAAIELYRQALEIDPGFALAHAGLAMAYGLRVQNFGFEARWTDQAVEVARHALALDAELPEAHKALGIGLGARGLLQEARVCYERAVSLSPRYDEALFNLAQLRHTLGEWDEALGALRRAATVDPVPTTSILSHFAMHLHQLGFEAEARRCLARVFAEEPLEIDTHLFLIYRETLLGELPSATGRLQRLLEAFPGRASCLRAAGFIALAEGRDADAAFSFGRFLESDRRPDPFARLGLAHAHQRQGRESEAAGLLEEVAALHSEQLDRGHEGPDLRRRLATVALLRGDREQALDWLERYFEAGGRDHVWCAGDPLLAPLRDDVRFGAQLGRMRTEVARMRERAAVEGWNLIPGMAEEARAAG